ncbi:hypothetical protein DB346_13405 [Verrucomicrobia bacterium LW23]|nr:hypothetical protein DB346_13405 [Verrucomicrobia bacterium LW23]
MKHTVAIASDPVALPFFSRRLAAAVLALLCTAALLLALPAAPALAQDSKEKHAIDKWYDAAMDKASSTHEFRSVTQQALAKWDAELNAAYKELGGMLKPAGKDALKAAQLQWIKFRDAEIEVIKNSIYLMDGTMWLQVGDNRVMELTRDRALQLRRTIQTLNEGGGIAD